MIGRWRELARDTSANMFMICAFSLVPMIFAIGFGIDYSRAMRAQTILQAAADSAALSAVSSTMMSQTNATARANATAMFQAQASQLTNLTFTPTSDLSVAITNSGSSGNGRTITLTWRAKSKNLFSTILGASVLGISGTSVAAATKAPNINYYLLLDNSPSMMLPSTSAGLSAIRLATSTSYLTNGCDFACHSQNPHNDNIYVRNSAGQDIWIDSSGNVWPISSNVGGWLYSPNYYFGLVSIGYYTWGHYADGWWLTHNYSSLYPGQSNILLRIDEERSAAQTLIPYAAANALANQATYQLQVFSFNWTHPGSSTPLTQLTSMTNVSTMATSAVPDLYASQDFWYNNNWPTSSYSNGDMGTEMANALSALNTVMPTSGTGGTSSTPQEVLLLITDGVVDETYNGSRWSREFNTNDLAQCSAIKAKGITIGIIYTQYLPDALTGDAWSQAVVAPYLGNVAPALQSCASTNASGTPLFFTVSTDGSISTALTSLFAATMQSARLVQ